MPPDKRLQGASNPQILPPPSPVPRAMGSLCTIASRPTPPPSTIAKLRPKHRPTPNLKPPWRRRDLQVTTLILSALICLAYTRLQAQVAPEPHPVAEPQKEADNPSASAPSPKLPTLSPWQILTTSTADRNPARRQEAIAALGTIGRQPRVINMLEKALADKDSAVRQLAATTLGEIRARGSIPRLKQALDDDSPEVSFAAAKSLWLMGDRTGRDVFLRVLSGDKSASDGLLKNGLETTKKKFQDPGKLAIIGAKEAASSLFGPAGWGIKVVEQVTQDRSASARAMSAILLGPDASADALKQLREALADKNWIVRAAAAQALGTSRRREQIPYLRPLLQDDKSAVRCIAAASIVRLAASPLASTAQAGKSAVPDSRPALDPGHQNAFR